MTAGNDEWQVEIMNDSQMMRKKIGTRDIVISWSIGVFFLLIQFFSITNNDFMTFTTTSITPLSP